jgi:hypothetical protein
MSKKGIRYIFFITLINFNVNCFKCSDSLVFVKWISIKYSMMPFIHKYYYYELIKSNSQSVLFEVAVRQNKNFYSLALGLGRNLLSIKFPDYSKVNNKNFDVIKANELNRLYSILGERNLNLIGLGIPFSIAYYRDFKRFSLGISTGIVFNRVLNSNSYGYIYRYPDTLSYHYVGVLINNKYSRTFTEIKLRYYFSSKLNLEFCLGGNLFSLLLPPRRNDFIDYYYEPYPKSPLGPAPPQPYVFGLLPGEYYNIELLLNRIQQYNLSLKINFTL